MQNGAEAVAVGCVTSHLKSPSVCIPHDREIPVLSIWVPQYGTMLGKCTRHNHHRELGSPSWRPHAQLPHRSNNPLKRKRDDITMTTASTPAMPETTNGITQPTNTNTTSAGYTPMSSEPVHAGPASAAPAAASDAATTQSTMPSSTSSPKPTLQRPPPIAVKRTGVCVSPSETAVPPSVAATERPGPGGIMRVEASFVRSNVPCEDRLLVARLAPELFLCSCRRGPIAAYVSSGHSEPSTSYASTAPANQGVAPPVYGFTYCAVIDGHGHQIAATFTAQVLPWILARCVAAEAAALQCSACSPSDLPVPPEELSALIERALKAAIVRLDQQLLELIELQPKWRPINAGKGDGTRHFSTVLVLLCCSAAPRWWIVNAAWLALIFLVLCCTGSCACLVVFTSTNIITAHVGDCRAVLVRYSELPTDTRPSGPGTPIPGLPGMDNVLVSSPVRI